MPTKEELDKKLSNTESQISKLRDELNNLAEETKKNMHSAEDLQLTKEIKESLTNLKEEINKLSNPEKDQLLAEYNKLKADYDAIIETFDEEFSSLEIAVHEEDSDGEALEDGQTDGEVEDGSADGESSQDTQPAEKKGVKEWFKEQRDGLTSKEEWKENTGKNIIRAVCGVGVLGGLIGLGNKIFNRPNWEKEIEGYKDMTKKEKRKARRKWRKEKRAKEGFWERPFGKTLKWVGILGSGYYLVHGFATGQRHPSEVFNWGKDEKIKAPETQVSDYEALTEEQREVYEKIGDNVNTFYGEIRKQDKKLGFVDEHYLGTISESVKAKNGQEIKTYKGLVPFCIDVSTDRIDRILSEHEIESLCFNSDKEKIWEEVQTWTGAKLEKLLGKFVPFLESFKSIGGDKLADKLTNWIKADDGYTEQRKEELEYFFRQYSKVIVYLNDKKTALEYELVRQEISVSGYNDEQIQGNPEHDYNLIVDAMNDGKWFEEYIKTNDKYKKFMSSRLFDIDKHLQEYDLNNGKVSEYLDKEILKDLNEKEQDILDIDEDAIQSAGDDGIIHTVIDDGIEELEDADSSLQSPARLSRMCSHLLDDIDDEFEQGFMHQYFEWISVLTNTADVNMAEFLEQTGLKDAVDGYKNIIEAIKTKISGGTVTKEDLQQLKQSTAKWFALKKEIRIATYSMKDIKEDNPDYAARIIESGWTLLVNTFTARKDIFTGNSDFGDYVTALGGLATIYIVTHPGHAVKIARNTTRGVVTKTLQAGSRLLGRGVTSPRMSTRGLGKRLRNISSNADKTSYFLSFLTEGGSRNEKRLLKIFREFYGKEFQTVGEGLEYIMTQSGMNGVTGDDLRKCCQNKNLARLAIERQASSNVPWYKRFLRRRQTSTYTVNKANVERIVGALDDLSHCSSDNQKILKSFLHSARAKDELELCHDLIYGVRQGDIADTMINGLGKIDVSYLKGASGIQNRPKDIYKYIAAEKFSGGNSDKKAIIELIIDDQMLVGSSSTNTARSTIKEYEGVKNTIKNLDAEEFKVIKEIFFDTSVSRFDTTLLRELFKNDTIERILREIGDLSSSEKTRAKIGKIIEDAVSTPQLKSLAQKLKLISDSTTPPSKFIRILGKMKKVSRRVKMLP